MGVTRQLIEFERVDPGEVEAALAALPDGGWVNIEPIVDEHDLENLRAHMPPAVVRIFSAKGRPIPMGTVVAQADSLAVGLEHSRGAKVVPELLDRGIAAPSGWRQQQDHAKRGVVYNVPRHESPAVVVGWILAAATTVSAVPIRGRWSAMVATP